MIYHFVALDLRPILVIDGVGFNKMMEYMEPGYTVSSRPQITATGPRIYTELKETQVTELCSQNISFTVDIWSSRATQGYITLTLHWVGGEWQLQNKVSFTAKNIANHLEQGFANINVTVVHNNASIRAAN